MARTALVDLLRRAAAISAVARHSGESLDEAIDRDIALRTDSSRRCFLRQSDSALASIGRIGSGSRIGLSYFTSG